MSYILDALRKADSERERGSVPGLHAHQAPMLADDAPPPRHGLWLKAGMSALIVLLLALLAWLWLDRQAMQDVQPKPMTSQGPSIAAAPTPPTLVASPGIQAGMPAGVAASTAAGTATGSSAAAPASMATLNPERTPPIEAGNESKDAPKPPRRAEARKPTPAPERSEPRRDNRSVATASSRSAPRSNPEPSPPQSRNTAATAPSGARTTATTAGAATAGAAAPEASGPIYPFNELPEHIRRELPKLSIGGAVHSKVAADRLLIIHGQLFHEGDALAPGLTLEQIRLKSAVLRYKGYRYELDF